MNKIYRLVWSATLSAWVVACEFATAKGKGKTGSRRKSVLSGSLAALALAGGIAGEAQAYVVTPASLTNGGTAASDGASVTNTAFGSGAVATGGNATAIGYGATASLDSAVAVGSGTAAAAISSVALGNNAKVDSTATSALSLGTNTSVNAGAMSSVAIGNGAIVDTNANSAFAMGVQAYTGAVSGIAIGNNASVSGAGTTSIAIGSKASATSDSAVALGMQSSVGGSGAVAVGGTSVASKTRSTALGFNANSSNTRATALGTDTKAAGQRSTAVGNAASAAADDSIALGSTAKATSDSTVALGYNATAGSATYDPLVSGMVAVGSNVSATAKGAVAMGSGGTAATGDQSIALGTGTTATQANAMAMGTTAAATAGGAIALGQQAQASSNFGIAIGYLTKAQADAATAGDLGTGATAVGDTANASGTAASAYGYNAAAVGQGATALGGYTAATKAYATAVGFQAQSAGGGATAVGNNANAAADYSTAIGRSATVAATGTSSTAIGRSANVSGVNAAAIGSGANASADQTVAIGLSANAKVKDGVALGSSSVANTGAGVLGYVPSGANASQTAAINATTSTLGAVSVGDAATGTFRQINGVAAGTQASDAVNVAQLQAAQTHYYSVNDNGAQGANYANDGATGANSLAAGINAKASQQYAIAVGQGANASGDTSLAVGNNTLSSGTLSAAFGAAAKATGGSSLAAGVNANASGFSATALGDSATAGYNATAVGVGATAINDATAVGEYAKANGAASAAFGYGATTNAQYATAIGSYSQATGYEATAIGTNTKATGGYSTAIGEGASATDESTVAIGRLANASVKDGVALGSNSVANTAAGVAGYVPTGANAAQAAAINATTSTLGAVSVGGNGQYRQITNVAAGTADADAVNVAQLKGAVSDSATHYYSVNDGGVQQANFNNDGATGLNALAAGIGASGAGENSLAMGVSSEAGGKSSVAVGESTQAGGESSVAMGTGAKAHNEGDVALGSGSETAAVVATAGTTIAGTDYAFAGANPTSTVSVGSAGNERTITNVAAGRLSADSTDAVNGSQLFASNQAIDNLNINVDNLDKGAVKYDVNPDGTVNYNSVTLAGDNGTTITNVAAGVNDTDAVNVSQLNDLADTPITFAGNSGSVDKKLGDTFTIEGVGSTAGTYSGNNLKTEVDAKGNLQLQMADAPTFGNVTVNADGSGKITGVTAGTDATDAVNVSQLTSATQDAVQYDDASHTTVTLNPGGEATTITNLAAGELSATSTDAVNGSQLFQTNENVTNLGDTVNNIYNTGTKYFHANSTGTDSVASGLDSVAIGMGAVASHDGSIALGAGSLADGSTLGSEAYLVGGTATGEVNIGDRRITGLSAGAEDTDAVNVAQLKAAAAGSVADAVMYDNSSHTSITLNKGGDTTLITNLTAGDVSADSTDAINGSQLYETNQNVTNLGDTVNNIYETGTKYFHANSTGDDSQAIGQDSVAIGMGAVSNNANDVALGAGSVTDAAVGTAGTTIAGTDYSFAGANPTSTVSVGSVGNERTITNVAAGRLSADSTDAVNGSQLFASNQAIDNLNINIETLDKGAVKYDVNPDGTVNYNSVTLAGDNGTTITNVAAGVNDTDAVNVSQLNDLADTPITFAGNSGSVDKKLGETFTIEGVGSTDGTYSGNNLKTEVDANGNLQLLMADAPKFGDVTINADGSGKITGLTAGTDATDAVNVSQLTSATENAVQYDNSTHTTITLNKGGDTTLITNLTAGDVSADSTDAINGSQLYETNQNITNLGDTVNNIYETGTKYFHANSTGTDSVASGLDSVAIGMGAVASHDGSIALGAGSLADGSTLGNEAYLVGGTATGEVNIGDRRITGLSAGAEDTDAVNVAQLKAVSSGITDTPITFAGNDGSVDKKLGETFTIEGVGSTDGSYSGNNLKTEVDANGNLQLLMADAPKFGDVTINADGSGKITGVTAGTDATDAVNVSQLTSATENAVQYDNSTHTTITLNKGGDTTLITNLTAGDVSADSTDAINGSQLYETNNTINNIYETGTKYFHANSTGADSQALGQDSVAIGMGAVSNNANDVALGAGSVTDAAVGTAGTTIAGTDYAFAGANPTSTVSVGSAGNERTITNVAAGRLSADSTDAVNGSQLFASNQAIDNLNINVDNLDKGAVKYDVNPDGTVNYNSVTMGGDTYNSVTKTGGTKITNVARGVDDSDAVNMSQLNETNANVTNLGDTINNFAGDQTTEYTEIHGRGIRYVRTNDTGLDLADSSAEGQGSTAVGYNATSIGDSSLALGRDSKANNAGDVALGAGSVTDAAVGTAGTTIAGTDYSFAGTNPTSTVSVGSAGNERTITNVAAGRLSADSTDAVNGSQLFASNQAIDNLNINVDNLDKGAVKYDTYVDGTINYNSITLAGDNGTTITNVAAGELSADSTDAVNGSQLYETNQNVTNLGDTINNFAGDQTTEYTEINGRGIRYVRTNDTGLDLADSSAQGQGSTAVGYNATSIGESSLALGRDSKANNAGDVALGQGSTTDVAVGTAGATIAGTDYAFAGTTPTSTVSVGSVGNERTITNVAAGRLSADSTDAVNGSQLFASNQAIDNLNINIDNLDKGAVKYDVNTDGTVNYNSVTMGGDTYNSETHTGGTTITNVADGVADSDAVNMSQLNETNAIINNFAGDQTTEYTEINGRGIRYVRTNDTGLDLADSSAQGQGSTAVGYNATSIGDSSLALGRDSKANNAGDVALGAGSVTDVAVGTAGTTIAGTDYAFAGTTPTSTVSVGSVGNERTITNVAAGRLSADSTDAVNGSQLFASNTAIDNLNINIDNLDKGAVKYDVNPDGTVNYNSVTMGGDTYNSETHTGGTTITNVADGVADSDAVNMSQLNETNAIINNFAGDQTTEYTEINGRGIRYVRTNDTGLDLADSSAQGQGSTAVGYNATSIGDSSLALGRDSWAVGEGSVASGNSAIAAGHYSTAMGAYSIALNDGDVALGAGSITDTAVGTAGTTIAGTTYSFAGAVPTSTVSVGSKGYERTLTNVAAGRLSADSTDAVNGSQLFATNSAIDNISNTVNVLDKGSVKYDVNTDGTVNYNSVTMGGDTYNSETHTGGTTITNVAAGVNGGDAVNVDQLNTAVAGSKTHYYSVNDNGVQGGNYENDGAQGVNSLASGVNAKATADGGVALGSDSVAGVEAGVKGYVPASASAEHADAIAATTSTRGAVSVGDADNGVFRQINGVAAGTVDSDAVNVAQLKGAIGSATANAVSYDDSTHNTVTLNGDTYNSTTHTGGTTITNVADGKAPSDAVNVSQLNQTNTNVTNISEGKDGMFQVNNTSNLPKPKPTGKDSTAGGAGAVASADNSTAIGSNAKASHSNSVAIGANSSTDRDNSVSVGSAGAERQITSVADGSADTDAVNLRQLNKATGDINNSINNVYNDLKHDLNKQDDTLSAGIAGALAAASLPQPYVPGASMASVGAGNYRGQQALAIGVSRISDNGKWVTKFSANADSQGDAGVSLGVGYQW